MIGQDVSEHRHILKAKLATLYAYVAPLLGLLLLNFESVWYGIGWGKLGGPAILLLTLTGFGCAVYAAFNGKRFFKILAALAVLIYFYFAIIQIL